MKNIKTVLIVFAAIIAAFMLYRVSFIRIVNYEIAGLKVPSEYNILTGKVRPILDYKGVRSALPSFAPNKTKNLGLSESETVVANLRWAVFEEWLKKHPEYKGWQSNADVFKEANDAFRKELESKTRAIAIK